MGGVEEWTLRSIPRSHSPGKVLASHGTGRTMQSGSLRSEIRGGTPNLRAPKLGELREGRSVEHRLSEMPIFGLAFSLWTKGKVFKRQGLICMDLPMDRNGSLCTKAGTRQVPLLEQQTCRDPLEVGGW